MEQQKQQTDNFYLDRIESAVASEEFKQMQNLLEPLNLVSIYSLLCFSYLFLCLQRAVKEPPTRSWSNTIAKRMQLEAVISSRSKVAASV